MKYDDEYDERVDCAVAACVITAWVALVAACIVFLFFLTGCTSTRYVPVESVRTEYQDKVREVRTTDSVVDTRFVYVKGDTVFGYRDRIKWRDRFIHDTVSVVRTDSIPMPYSVERSLSWWEQTKMDLGGFAMACIAAALCVSVVWCVRRIKVK